jgi:hypothetical protein
VLVIHLQLSTLSSLSSASCGYVLRYHDYYRREQKDDGDTHLTRLTLADTTHTAGYALEERLPKKSRVDEEAALHLILAA